MAFGKIDTATNFLMTSGVNIDGTYRALTDFVEKAPGEYWTYYINTTTPDADKNTAETQGLDEEEKNKLIKEITVDYVPSLEAVSYTFSGSEESQAKMINAAGRIKGNSPNKTQNIFDVNHKVVKLTSSDIEAVLALIEPIYESITN